MFGCRGCIDGGGTGFGAVLTAAFPERPIRTARNTIGSPSISRTPRTSPLLSTPEPADTGPDPRAAFVRLLWARAVPPDPTPGRAVPGAPLRMAPAGIGPNLPATVRWLAHEASPGSNRAAS